MVSIVSIEDRSAPEVAARAIAAGGVIAFPTDTVYGLGAGLWQPEAIARLYALKGRPEEKALPVLLSGVEETSRVATRVSAGARRLMLLFWPGALTIVLPRRPDIPAAVGALTTTIAVRVPAQEDLRRVLAQTGPLASSSANRSGAPAATSADEALHVLGHGVDLLLDGGPLPARPPSTVVDVTGPEPVVLRQGAITATDIARALSTTGLQ